jgi:hypothetical protein
MMYLKFILAVAVSAAFALPTTAQERRDSNSSSQTQVNTTSLSPGQTAMQNASSAGKFLFIHFWKEKNPQTEKTWKALQAGAAKYADTADVVTLQTTDPAEKAIVGQFNVSKAPMPLILSIAPSGAVTKAFQSNFDEKQLAAAFVSPCEQLVMKAIQSNKLVFVCVAYDKSADGQTEIPQCVKDFKADEKYSSVTETVTLNAADEREAKFLKELQDNTKEKKPVAVLLAPGALIGTFDAKADKKQIIAKITDAQAGCCPGGSCGPGGCGPKK